METSKDAALRSIGRTVVNFQRLEHNLKRSALIGSMRGAAPKALKDMERRRKRAEVMTLGQAIQAWLDASEGEETQEAYTPDLFDVTIQSRFSLEQEAEARDAHAAALQSLLEARNSLIHVRLAQVQWDVPEACDQLVVELDQLNRAVVAQIEYTHVLLAAISDLFKEGAEQLERKLSDRLAE